MNEYYVYAYVRLDTNTYFYIGKGKKNRYLRLDNRKAHFMNILNKTDCAVEILYDNLTEEEAFRLEKETIDDLVFNEGYSININSIDKNDDGTHLVNYTWGGEGTSGLSVKQSQETIDKRVAKNTGKKRSAEQKANLSKGRQKRLKEHPEDLEKLRQSHIGVKLSDETKKKISESHKGKIISEEHRQKISDAFNNKSQEEKDELNYRRSWTSGTHIYCVELNKIFPSKHSAIKYIKSTYGILFNKDSLNRCLKGELDYYGIIIIDNQEIKLHWEFYK